MATISKTTANDNNVPMNKKSVFETLNAINVNGHTEKKKAGGRELTYLSWAWAWAEVKKAYPEANYTIYERPDGCIYWTDGKTCWVKTGVTIEGLEHIEYLPVMDYRNQSISVDNITSMDVNKAIQRSLTKAAARHGLGLYIYAGEDLPEEPEDVKAQRESEAAKQQTEIAELNAIVGNVDKMVRSITEGMTRDQKVAFAQEVIMPVIGGINYKTCKDKTKLNKLVDELRNRTKAS